MTPHETGTPGTPRATAPPAPRVGPQGPTLGELSDAYLQDYQVRQFRSQSTARGRIAHLTACFGRAARAAALTTYQIRQYQTRPARRRGGHRHHQSRDLGPPPHVHGVVARIVTGPHDASRQDPHRPMRYDIGRPRAVIRFRISQPRTASLPCPAGLRARRPSPMMDLYRKNVFSTRA